MAILKSKKFLALVLTALGAVVGWGAFWYVHAGGPAQVNFVPLGSSQRSQNSLVPGPSPVRVLFVGDIMLDRRVADMAAARGADSLFASTTELFADADLRVSNLEGTVTDNPSIAQVDHSTLRFTFSPALAKQVLQALNLSAVSSANNHAYDFGKDGYDTTRNYLAQWGIAAFGQPFNNPDYLSTKLAARGKTICLVGYMQLWTPGTSTVVGAIQTMRSSCDRVVVFAHWGDEYSHEPTPAQVSAAHAFIDAGADLVIGAHPHVVQPFELYQGKPIIYSLGNAMFDQEFSWDTTHGLAVRADFYPNHTDLTFIPLTLVGERLKVAEGDAQERILGQVGVAVATVTVP